MNVVLIDLHPHSDPVTPISLANLAAVLRRLGHDTDLLSLSSGRPFSPAALRRYLHEKQPRLVGFTAYLTLVGRLGPEKAAYCTVLFPVVALNVSAWVEGYTWTLLGWVGLVAVMAGNVLVFARGWGWRPPAVGANR